MEIGFIITCIGITVLLVYGIINILQFYGVGHNMYGPYLAFYIFIFISAFVLPQQYSIINVKSEK
jgi:hypothetical protein